MISPEVGKSKPPMRFNNVDLPLPDLPSKKIIPFSGKSKETLSNALVSSPPFVL